MSVMSKSPEVIDSRGNRHRNRSNEFTPAPLITNDHPVPSVLYHEELTLDKHPVLLGHAVGGKVIVPGAAYIEFCNEVGNRLFGRGMFRLSKVRFTAICAFLDRPSVQMAIEATLKNSKVVLNCKNSEKIPNDIVFMNCEIHKHDSDSIEPLIRFPNLTNSKFVSQECFYTNLKKRGINYSGPFCSVKRVMTDHNQAIAKISIDKDYTDSSTTFFSAAVLDCAFQLASVLGRIRKDKYTYIPMSIDTFSSFGALPPLSIASIKLIKATSRIITLDLDVYCENVELVAQIRGLKMIRNGERT